MGRPRRIGPRKGDYIPASNGCWNWQLALDKDGYGFVTQNYKVIRAHKYYYEYYLESIPKGLVIDHLCRNKACVNPGHMEPVTVRENTIRGEGPEKSRQRQLAKTHCPKGHPYSGHNLVQKKSDKGRRRCRTCISEQGKRYREKRRSEK